VDCGPLADLLAEDIWAGAYKAAQDIFPWNSNRSHGGGSSGYRMNCLAAARLRPGSGAGYSSRAQLDAGRASGAGKVAAVSSCRGKPERSCRWPGGTGPVRRPGDGAGY
jgi:hypothetical protein